MISSVLVAITAAYAIAFVVLVYRMRTVPEDVRQYCYPILAAIGISVPLYILDVSGIGAVTVAGEAWDPLRQLQIVIVGLVIFPGTCLLAGLNRTYVGLVAVAAVVAVGGFNVLALADGIVAIAGIVSSLIAHGVLFWVLLGPGWRAAKRQSDYRRLLYWKLRNLLVFLFAFNLVVALMAHAMFTEFARVLLVEYLQLTIAVGFAAFVFANVDVLEDIDFDFNLANHI